MASVIIDIIKQNNSNNPISGNERIITVEKNGSISTTKIEDILNKTEGGSNLNWVDVK